MSSEPISTGVDEAAVTISDCLRYWRNELLGLAREIWAPITRQSTRTIAVCFSPFGTTISRLGPDGEAELGVVQPDDADDAPRLAAALLGAGLTRSDEIALKLPADEILRPRVRLPYVRHGAIRAMLGYELEQISPLRLDELYFDFRIIARMRKSNFTEVELRIVKRSVLRDALDIVHAAGFCVGAILFENDPRPADWIHFPVDRIGYLRRYWRRHGIFLLAGLCAVLAVAVGVGAYARGEAVYDGIEDQLETQRLEVVQVEHIRREIAGARAQIEFPAMQKATQPSLLSILSAMTTALPDGTWLISVKVEGKKVHAQGYSHAASDLIGLIDRSRQFANAQFNAPVVQSSNKFDRFDITFDVKPGGGKVGGP